jgi:hypothetical protein
MPISYPNTQQSAGTTSTGSFTPHAFEVLTSASLPITITGNTGSQFLFTFFLPPDITYKTQQNKYYIGLVGSCTGSSPTVTASLEFNAGQAYTLNLTPADPFNTGFNSYMYERFKNNGQALDVDLSQLSYEGQGVSLPVYISGTSAFTASIHKVYLSPT